MGRWLPDAQLRLLEAAMDLFLERGFEATLVADIAARAGLTERTFFRYFTDKREVLFGGSAAFQELILANFAKVPPDAPALDAVLSAYEATEGMFEQRKSFARKRVALTQTHDELRERELVKMAMVTEKLAKALRDRGVDALEARFAAEMGTSVFRLAFETWTTDRKNQKLTTHVRKAREALKRIVA